MRRDLRRLHRLACRAPVRRHHDRPAPTPSSRTRPASVRRLSREEILTYITVVAGAGNETTTRLIGWAGKVLADHPDQRRAVGRGPQCSSRTPSRSSFVSRPPAPTSAVRHADVELLRQTVPEGSAMLFSSGRQPRRPSLRRRPIASTSTANAASTSPSAIGIHFCLGVGPGPLRGSDRARRGPDALPRVGGRSAQRQAGADLDGPRLGGAPRLHLVNRPAADPDHPPSPGRPRCTDPDSV